MKYIFRNLYYSLEVVTHGSNSWMTLSNLRTENSRAANAEKEKYETKYTLSGVTSATI